MIVTIANPKGGTGKTTLVRALGNRRPCRKRRVSHRRQQPCQHNAMGDDVEADGRLARQA